MSDKSRKIVIAILLVLIIICIFCYFYFKGQKTYTISFDTDGGTATSAINVRNGNKIAKPADPTKEGYEFVEWQLNGKTYNFDTPIVGNATLTAVWREVSVEEETFVVRFDTDGGSILVNQHVKPGEQATLPETPTKEGDDKVKYTFVEWQSNGKKYDFSTPVTSNITLTAKWGEEQIIEKFTITFDTDGGSAVKSQTIGTGKKVTKPTNPTKKGYVFVEWQLNEEAYDFSTPVTSDITLTAKWIDEASVEKFTVTFNTNGGSVVNVQTVIKGAKATKPADPTKEGYAFVEWQLNGKTYNFNTVVTSNITLTAKWNQQKYTVTFNSNGGSAVSSQTINSGAKATKPTNPTREGYIFVEWQLNGSAFNFNTAITSNITLIAKWNQNTTPKYKVTFNSNGGSTINAQLVVKGATAIRPADPTRSGYTFVEWQLNGSEFDFNTVITNNITLTAKWEQNAVQKYTVTFNSNGGSSVSSQTVNSGAKATKPTNPTKEGHTFVEWQLNGSAFNFNTAITSNITLTAKWNQKTYTIRAVPKDDFSPYLDLYVYENGTKISVYALYYASDGAKLNGFSENKNTLESAYLVQLSSGGTKFRANVVQ